MTEQLKQTKFEEDKVEELYGEVFMSSKAQKKEGRGYAYPAFKHIIGLEWWITKYRKKLLAMTGYWQS